MEVKSLLRSVGCLGGILLCGTCSADGADGGVTVSQSDEKISSIDAYSGFYVGVGVGRQQWKNTWNLSDNLGEAYRLNCAQNILAPLGNISDRHDYHFGNGDGSKLGGFVFLGYNHVISQDFLVGFSLTADFAGSKSRKLNHAINDDTDYMETTTETRGFCWTGAIELGRYISMINSLVSLRIGLCSTHSKLKSEFFERDFSNNSCSPAVGVGYKTNLLGCVNLNCSVDYRFASKKRWASVEVPQIAYDAYRGTIKNDIRGFVVRVGVEYNFNQRKWK